MDEQSSSDFPVFGSGRGQIPENHVEYHLFLIRNQTGHQTQLQELELLRKTATNLCNTLLKDYIWQRDEFHLEVQSSQGMTYLHGTTDYGDAVEDEWLIVYLLRQLTLSFPELWVHVADADGEFLLIEAANVLPKWITPDIDQNRVWIHDSKLFIIPPSATTDLQQNPKYTNTTLRNAFDYLRTKPNALVHSPLIQVEAFHRLEKYPDFIHHSAHYSLITIPRKLAYILHEMPKTIPMAVEMFYLRDAITLKPITSASVPLLFPPEDFVTTSVHFTRVLFAQLKSQHMDPPPRWQAVHKDCSEVFPSEAQKFARQDMGMKLTCGYEMLSVDADKSKHRVVRELAILLQALAGDGDASLPTNSEMESWANHQRDDAEDWMDIDYLDFERELDGRRQSTSREGDTGFGDPQVQSDLRKIVSRFEAFLSDNKAGLDGIDLDKVDGNLDEETDNGDDDSDEDSEYEDKAVSFDEEVYSQMMREMLGMPGEDATNNFCLGASASDSARQSSRQEIELDSDDLHQLSSEMEVELKRYGALDLQSETSTQRKVPALKQAHTEQQQPSMPAVDESVEELDINYNLARNILESFKGQAGVAGPTSNLLGMMGFSLPRDEDDGTRES
ncbi:regulatory factor Sgt1 [Metarhizium rileyi]|uniref:Regulatory factor Sgt1 n=1 Tax=Metarhizium rileyi (strain RCEF 4871) TaxID=1649241 RepID=A0A167IWS0_METRR|nr:regulatory factor Sgt1 [Metarhizium rileyi RCEF 4871]